MAYKIAAVTEDGKSLSSHFGMAPAYRVFTIDNGRILAEEERLKPHHSQHPDHQSGQPHGHEDMFAPIADCKVLLCGGMGTPAYQKARSSGLDVVMTGGEIEAAVRAFMDGRVTSDLSRIHQH